MKGRPSEWATFFRIRNRAHVSAMAHIGILGLSGWRCSVNRRGCWILFELPSRIIALAMASGSGVLISALSFELMDEAYQKGGFQATAIGFISGAIVYTAANKLLTRYGAKHRKMSAKQPAEDDQSGSGAAIAVGELLDGIPESIVIGLSLLDGGAVSSVAVVAIFLSNLPE